MVAVEVEHRTWGRWPSVRLSTGAASLEVVAEVGARLVSLRDEQRRREWLSQGEPPSELEQVRWADESVVFGGRESFGWDECLPTTAPCPDPLTPAGPALRDHGDQWGRGAYLSIEADRGAVVHTWSAARWSYRLTRRLAFEDARTLLAEYTLRNHADTRMPLSWAMHPVLAVEPGSRIELPGVDRLRCSWRHGIGLPDVVRWPIAEADDGRAVDLSVVRAAEGWAAVLYADPLGRPAVVAADGARLEIDWDRRFAPSLRMWQSYGGWPSDEDPREQIALEPCTSAHDDLGSAIADRAARTLSPRSESHWWVRLRLT